MDRFEFWYNPTTGDLLVFEHEETDWLGKPLPPVDRTARHRKRERGASFRTNGMGGMGSFHDVDLEGYQPMTLVPMIPPQE